MCTMFSMICVSSFRFTGVRGPTKATDGFLHSILPVRPRRTTNLSQLVSSVIGLRVIKLSGLPLPRPNLKQQ